MAKEEQLEVKDLIVNPLKFGKKVTIEPVLREGGWLKAKGKDNSNKDFLLPGSKFRMKGTPYLIDKRVHVNPLTEEEIKFFESEEAGLGIKKGELSIYKKKGYWSYFEVVLDKNILTLDLGNPMDYLRYKFLLSQLDIIAPSWEERLNKGTYKYVIKDVDAIRDQQSAKIEKEMIVMDYYAKIRKSERKMKALLTLFYNTKEKYNSKKVPKNATLVFLTTEVYKIVTTQTSWVYDLLQDKFFDERVLMTQGIEKGVILKLSASEYQIVGEEDILNMREMLEFLNSKKNQLIRSKVEAQIEVQK